MDGVITLLPEPFNSLVEEIWNDLAETCGVRGVFSTPVPHFSWHVAERYDQDLLQQALKELCAHTRPFQVHTAGLGVFSREHPVVFISLVKDARLLQLHKRLCRVVAPLATGEIEYYLPANWMPHITLVFEDLSRDNLSCVLERLVFRSFEWSFSVDNLALGGQSDEGIGSIYFQVPFGGSHG